MSSNHHWHSRAEACLKIASLMSTVPGAPKKKLFRGTGSGMMQGLNANKMDPVIKQKMDVEDTEDGVVV